MNLIILFVAFIKQRKIYDNKKNLNKLEARAPIYSSDNEIQFNNNKNNINYLTHQIEEDLNNENLGRKVSKKDFDSIEKLNDLLASTNNKLSWPINSINKTNNKSNIGNKSGKMSFMKTIDELGIYF
jgi:hypothetical protein